jgi:hypothetical protein
MAGSPQGAPPPRYGARPQQAHPPSHMGHFKPDPDALSYYAQGPSDLGPPHHSPVAPSYHRVAAAPYRSGDREHHSTTVIRVMPQDYGPPGWPGPRPGHGHGHGPNGHGPNGHGHEGGPYGAPPPQHLPPAYAAYPSHQQHHPLDYGPPRPQAFAQPPPHGKHYYPPHPGAYLPPAHHYYDGPGPALHRPPQQHASDPGSPLHPAYSTSSEPLAEAAAPRRQALPPHAHTQQEPEAIADFPVRLERKITCRWAAGRAEGLRREAAQRGRAALLGPAGRRSGRPARPGAAGGRPGAAPDRAGPVARREAVQRPACCPLGLRPPAAPQPARPSACRPSPARPQDVPEAAARDTRHDRHAAALPGGGQVGAGRGALSGVHAAVQAAYQPDRPRGLRCAACLVGAAGGGAAGGERAPAAWRLVWCSALPLVPQRRSGLPQRLPAARPEVQPAGR